MHLTLKNLYIIINVRICLGIMLKNMRDISKVCVTQPFFACGNTVAPELNAHVTESIPSAHVKFRSNRLKREK